MALSSYTPVLAWFADGLTDLDTPTGTTASNKGAYTSPSLTGSPDKYADFAGTNDISFLPASAVQEVGTGDFTVVMKARVDTFTAGKVLWQNYDGAGTSGAHHGLSISVISGSGRSVGLGRPPTSTGSARIESAQATFTAGQDFLIAFKRTSGTCAVFGDAGAATGLSSMTPYANTFGSGVIDSCGDVTFGSDRDGANGFDGRIYWLLGFNAAISDSDLQSTDWLTEATLKTTWFSSSSVAPLASAYYRMLNS